MLIYDEYLGFFDIGSKNPNFLFAIAEGYKNRKKRVPLHTNKLA